MQHVLEHGPILLCVGARKIWHEVDIHLETASLQQASRPDCCGSVMPSIDVCEDRVVSVLHADLNPGATVAPQPANFRRGDMVRPGFQGKADDLCDGPLVKALLFKQRPTLSDPGRVLPFLAQLAQLLVKGVGSVEEISAELLLVVSGIVRPGAPEHDNLHLVHRVTLLRKSAGPIIKLSHRAELVLISSCNRRLCAQVGPGLAGLVWAVVAVVGT
mmetsp:Transcript_55681/g.133239  ORF Transcript_55681/g.133239 Transcript_55681/m.133239 type:complete len:216 (+) Transcript_55681:1389-2036(+)